MEVIFCENCGTIREFKVRTRMVDRKFRGDTFSITEQYASCKVCGNDLSSEEYANDTLKTLSNLYQEKHNISPETIKAARKSTGLTQDLYAKALNMGIATVKRYEVGTSVPSKTQIGIIKMLIKDPLLINKFIEENKDNFTDEDILKLNKRTTSTK